MTETEHTTSSGPYARRACCTTYHDQPHRPGCAFKQRSRTYNADLSERLAHAAATGASARALAVVDVSAIGTAGDPDADPVAGAYYENDPDLEDEAPEVDEHQDHEHGARVRSDYGEPPHGGPVVEVVDPYGRTLATMHADGTPAEVEHPGSLF